LAHIADTPRDFVAACETALRHSRERHLRRADAFLVNLSWDKTWSAMEQLMLRAALGLEQRPSGERLSAPFEEQEALEVG
jgi:hypothetical protein